MEISTVNWHPPNDPADYVANRVNFPGVTTVQYDAETDQMQVGARPSDYGPLAESVRTHQAVGTIVLT